jgi:hypothetical protein
VVADKNQLIVFVKCNPVRPVAEIPGFRDKSARVYRQMPVKQYVSE